MKQRHIFWITASFLYAFIAAYKTPTSEPNIIEDTLSIFVFNNFVWVFYIWYGKNSVHIVKFSQQELSNFDGFYIAVLGILALTGHVTFAFPMILSIITGASIMTRMQQLKNKEKPPDE